MIKFPKMHIADSVLNRIKNELDGISPLNVPMPIPAVPDPTQQGLDIDAAVATPAAPTEALTPEETEGMIDSSAMGGSPFDGALLGSLPSLE